MAFLTSVEVFPAEKSTFSGWTAAGRKIFCQFVMHLTIYQKSANFFMIRVLS